MARKAKLPQEDMQEKKRKFEQVAGDLQEIPVEKFLKDNFLPYAWSFNLDRALVDVTGLKPVQRRILYTMYKDGLTPTSGRSKVATLAGRVLAYHPHGNASVEDALKNLGRDHIFRVPLIDGKGDYGVPGTPGAAGRYIEARLNKAAWLNVEELAEHAVRMVPNYDGETTEPLKLPVKWPISVINGGAGIAIAYASNMPSHNPTEVMKAVKALLRNPDMTHKALQKIILGPDFNMGGTITSNDGIKEYLETGTGSFKIRGNYTVSPRPRGASRIEFHEIPFGTFPEKVISNIQDGIAKGRFKEIATFKDLSDLRHPIRIIIDTKPGTNHKRVLQDLFAYTTLESSFSANITTIVDNKPRSSSMKELLLEFIEFRKDCVRNKLAHALEKKNARMHLISGLLKTLLDIDAAIAIIRKSEDSDAASTALQKKFKIDKLQADYVLSLQLRRLTKMDSVGLKNEATTLQGEIDYFKSVLSEEEVLKDYLLKDFDETLKVIGDERKTEIISQSFDEFVQAEKAEAKELKVADKNVPAYLTRFADGKVMRSTKQFAYDEAAKVYAHGPIVEQLKIKTQDMLVFIGSDGLGRKIPAGYVAEDTASGPKELGLTLPKGVRLVGFSRAEAEKSDVGVALATRKGAVKLAKTDFPNKEEFPVMLIDADDEVVETRWIGKTLTGTYFYLASSGGNMLIFDATTLRLAGSKAGGVKGMSLKEASDKVINFGWIQSMKDADAQVLSKATKTIKLTPLSEIPTKSKGGQGVMLHTLKPGEKMLTDVFVATNPVLSLRGFGNAVKTPAVSKRAARGVEFDPPVDFGQTSVTAY